jgi:hypothetical protein
MSNPTRREVLKGLAKAGAIAPLLALPLATERRTQRAESGPDEVTRRGQRPSHADSEYVTIHKSLLEYAPTQPAPYGPPERTATIDAWHWRIDKVIVALETLWTVVGQARALPPGEVDGAALISLECEVNRLMENLVDSIDHSDENEEFYRAATGKCKYFWCLKKDIEGGQASREILERELDSYKDDPAFAELQALLEARFGA